MKSVPRGPPAPGESRRAVLRGGLAGWQVRKIVRLAASAIGDLTVATMAEAANLSASHFSRAFRVSFGLPPREWLLQQKMQSARDRLQNSQDTVEQIASDLGYRTSSQFCRAFRVRFGSSPRAYRRR